jgi:Sulfotransferase family
VTSRRKDPIFVVGTGRSGTTLLASLLDRHSGIACGPETAFFQFARPTVQRRIIEDPHWPEQAVRFLSGIDRERAGSVLEAYGLTADEVRRALRRKPRTIRSVLEAITEPYARSRGKRRWAEKTPAHVMHVHELRRLWPDSRIVRVVRDPRGVVASRAKVPFGPRTAVGSAYLWKRQDEAARGFFHTDPLAVVVRYEDLVADPEHVMRGLCTFLGEEFEPAMLDVTDEAHVVASGETWKWRVGSPIDTSRVDAWRDELPLIEQERVTLVCADGMRRNGYEGARRAKGILRVHRLDANLIDVAELIEPVLDAGFLVEDAPADARLGDPLPDLIWGLPGENRWIKGVLGASMRAATRLFLRLAGARLESQPVLRIERSSGRVPRTSTLERLGDSMVTLLTRPMTASELPRFRSRRGAASLEPEPDPEPVRDRELQAAVRR